MPDLNKWGETIRHLLKDDGFFYLFDSHPFFLMLNCDKLPENILEIQYPYFSKAPDIDDSIGGYASEVKKGVQAYFWMYKVSDLINALSTAGLHIAYFNEFEQNFFNAGGMDDVGGGLYHFSYNTGKFPMSFSLKATVYGGRS